MKTTFNKVKFLAVLYLAIGIHACSESPSSAEEMPTQQEVNKGMEQINRKFALDEAVQINAYIERRDWEMKTTGTGLRYMIYEQGKGDSVRNGWKAEIDYVVSLLDGTELYNSSETGSKIVTVGMDNIESGLHEGLQLMRVGDKAKFILPSHLAHGLTGDNSKIPPRSSVVYDIQLLDAKER